MIFYLAQGYASDPFAFENACKWTYDLRKKGFTIYSPILHCHPFHEELRPKESEMKYEEWDLKICDAFLKHDAICVENDAFIKQFDSRLSYYTTLEAGMDCAEVCDGRCTECSGAIFNKYDSGLTMLFASTCFQYIGWKCLHCGEMCQITRNYATEIYCSKCNDWNLKQDCPKTIIWTSSGAEKEWQWAKKHFVKCLKLDPFLEGQNVYI